MSLTYTIYTLMSRREYALALTTTVSLLTDHLERLLMDCTMMHLVVPPSPTLSPYVPGLIYDGCFKDSKSRVMSRFISAHYNGLTNEGCLDACAGEGYEYAGTQNSLECFCGDHSPKLDAKTSDSDCSSACKGRESEMCGGPWRISVYHAKPETLTR